MTIFKMGRTIFTGLLVSMLAACGGGGSNETVVPTKGLALTTNSASAITLAVGETGTYTAAGGGNGTNFANYQITSSNSSVAQVAIKSATFTITGMAPGTSTITVTDGSTGSVPIAVTVSGSTTPPQFRINAPATITTGLGATTQYSILGGIAPYSATSNNAGVAVASVVNGSVLTITGVSKGQANIVVYDAAGSSTAVAITAVSVVGATPLFTTMPNPSVLAVNQVSTYTIGGGVAPFTVSSSNQSVASATLSGSTVNVTGITKGSSTILIVDSLGTSLSVSITVGSGSSTALFATIPNPSNLASGSSSQYVVSGGIAPYVVASSNANVVTVSLNGSSLNVNAVNAGTANVVIFDAAGSSFSAQIIVPAGSTSSLFSTMPAIITLSKQGTATYTIGGGSAPYTVTSANTSVLAIVQNGNSFTLNAVNSGFATVTIVDSVGGTTTNSVTVASAPAPTGLYTTAPNAISVGTSGSATYTIAGGTGVYTVTSSDTSVATATIDKSNLSITGLKNGSAQVVVFDSTGTAIKISVTVGSGASTIPLFTSAPLNVTIAANAEASYIISGGSAPYQVVSSNTASATVNLQGNVFTISGIASGISNVIVHDVNGASVTIGVTVP